jgi:hypothetical protein
VHPSKLFTHRPSAAMLVALTALFVAMGGGAYAAISIPNNSVGSNQLKNSAVTNHKIENGSVGNFKLASGAVGARKIINGAVGKSQVNANQVQERVTGVCSSGAVTSVGSTGTVTCGAAPGADVNTSNPSPITLGTGATTIDSESLPGNLAYLVTANPQIALTGLASGSESVTVNCTLTAGPSTTAAQTRSVVVELGTNNQTTTIPLSVVAPSNPTAISAGLSCTDSQTGGSTTPTVTATTSINALQVASVTTVPYAG